MTDTVKMCLVLTICTHCLNWPDQLYSHRSIFLSIFFFIEHYITIYILILFYVPRISFPIIHMLHPSFMYILFWLGNLNGKSVGLSANWQKTVQICRGEYFPLFPEVQQGWRVSGRVMCNNFIWENYRLTLISSCLTMVKDTKYFNWYNFTPNCWWELGQLWVVTGDHSREGRGGGYLLFVGFYP